MGLLTNGKFMIPLIGSCFSMGAAILTAVQYSIMDLNAKGAMQQSIYWELSTFVFLAMFIIFLWFSVKIAFSGEKAELMTYYTPGTEKPSVVIPPVGYEKKVEELIITQPAKYSIIKPPTTKKDFAQLAEDVLKHKDGEHIK